MPMPSSPAPPAPLSGPEAEGRSGARGDPVLHDPAFRDIAHWVFDLDNTLYSARCRIFEQVDQRMGTFIAEHFGLDPVAARGMQKAYYRRYGTTLRGLMLEHGIDPRAYLDYVHDIDLAVVEPAPGLDSALAALEGHKTIFTNASRAHAEQVIDRLGIARHFSAIFDIHDADYIPKPSPETFRTFVSRHGIEGPRAVLFEDTAANLAPAAALGMTTVLVIPGEEGVTNDPGSDHIHHVTDDLARWLDAVIRARQGPRAGPEAAPNS